MEMNEEIQKISSELEIRDVENRKLKQIAKHDSNLQEHINQLQTQNEHNHQQAQLLIGQVKNYLFIYYLLLFLCFSLLFIAFSFAFSFKIE